RVHFAGDAPDGNFVAPHIFELSDANELVEEVFGPVLHVVRYRADRFDQVLQSIERSGYGLTLGIHSRIDDTVEDAIDALQVGNIYVNRNMIGAVVGVQPFGGHGLSGTGPKAGGPHYLPRFATEQTVTVNTAAAGGNAALMSGGEQVHRPSNMGQMAFEQDRPRGDTSTKPTNGTERRHDGKGYF